MSAPVGDLLGIQCVFMPSGFGVPVAPTPTTKGRRPVRLTIARPRPVLPIPDEAVVVSGTVSAVAITYPAAVLVERTAGGIVAAVARTEPAEVGAHRVLAGQVIASAGVSGQAVRELTDVETLYLAGVL